MSQILQAAGQCQDEVENLVYTTKYDNIISWSPDMAPSQIF